MRHDAWCYAPIHWLSSRYVWPIPKMIINQKYNQCGKRGETRERNATIEMLMMIHSHESKSQLYSISSAADDWLVFLCFSFSFSILVLFCLWNINLTHWRFHVFRIDFRFYSLVFLNTPCKVERISCHAIPKGEHDYSQLTMCYYFFEH